MKTKAVWFLAGFAVSWMTWSTVGFVRHRAGDHTRNWPGVLRDMAAEAETLQWLRKSNAVRVGNYLAFTPADSSNASVYFQSPNAAGLPGITIQDENGNGTLDSILVADSANRNFSFADKDGDGVFDSYEYTTGIELDSESFRDDDMDGQYDCRIGPGPEIAVAFDS